MLKKFFSFLMGGLCVLAIIYMANGLSNKLIQDKIFRNQWQEFTQLSNFKNLNYQKLLNASVMISGTFSKNNQCYNKNPAQDCSGSGIVIRYDSVKNESYILTNKHVVFEDFLTNCSLIVFSHNKSKSWTGKGYLMSMNDDLALVKVQGYIAEPVQLSNRPIGQFENLVNFSSSGCVSDIVVMGYIVSPNIIKDKTGQDSQQIMLSVDHGSSGSGVYNEKGKLVGVIWATLFDFRVPNGFMIPLSNIKRFLDEAFND